MRILLYIVLLAAAMPVSAQRLTQVLARTNGVVDSPTNFWDANRLAMLGSLELDLSINSGTPNSTNALIHWSQLLGVPAGFADGTDDGGGGGGAGTVTSVGLSTSLSGLSVGSSPVTSSGTITLSGTLGIASGGTGATDQSGARTALGLSIGTDVQAFDSDLSAWAGLAGTGIGVRTGTGTAATRTITGDSEISVANGDGVAGNPTLAIGASIARDAEVAAAYQPLDADLTDLADGSLSGSKVGTGIDGGNISAGTVSDARIDGVIARDSEVAAAYQPLSAPLTLLGKTNVVLSFSGGTNIATDCSVGRTFRVSLTNAAAGNLNTPTSPTDGAEYRWVLAQDATGTRLVYPGSGFAWSEDLTGSTSDNIVSTNASRITVMQAVYDAISAKFLVTRLSRGYQ